MRGISVLRFRKIIADLRLCRANVVALRDLAREVYGPDDHMTKLPAAVEKFLEPLGRLIYVKCSKEHNVELVDEDSETFYRRVWQLRFLKNFLRDAGSIMFRDELVEHGFIPAVLDELNLSDGDGPDTLYQGVPTLHLAEWIALECELPLGELPPDISGPKKLQVIRAAADRWLDSLDD